MNDARMYINLRLEQTRKEQEEWREKQRESGLRGAKERWKDKENNDGNPNGNPNGQNMALQSSVFSLQSSPKEKDLKASFNYQGGENDGSFKEKTQAALNKVLIKFPRFPHARLLSNAFAINKHPEAIIYALEETATKCNGLDPAKYFETILQRTSGNFYEREHISESEKHKIEPGQVGNIFKNLGVKI